MTVSSTCSDAHSVTRPFERCTGDVVRASVIRLPPGRSRTQSDSDDDFLLFFFFFLNPPSFLFTLRIFVTYVDPSRQARSPSAPAPRICPSGARCQPHVYGRPGVRIVSVCFCSSQADFLPAARGASDRFFLFLGLVGGATCREAIQELNGEVFGEVDRAPYHSVLARRGAVAGDFQRHPGDIPTGSEAGFELPGKHHRGRRRRIRTRWDSQKQMKARSTSGWYLDFGKHPIGRADEGRPAAERARQRLSRDAARCSRTCRPVRAPWPGATRRAIWNRAPRVADELAVFVVELRDEMLGGPKKKKKKFLRLRLRVAHDQCARVRP